MRSSIKAFNRSANWDKVTVEVAKVVRVATPVAAVHPVLRAPTTTLAPTAILLLAVTLAQVTVEAVVIVPPALRFMLGDPKAPPSWMLRHGTKMSMLDKPSSWISRMGSPLMVLK